MSELYEKEKILKAVRKDSLINDLSTVSKIIAFIIFIGFTASFNRYDLYGLFPMGIYPLCMIILSEIPLYKFIKPILIALPFGFFTALGNIIFDNYFSAVTVLLKIIYSIICLYILTQSSGIENVCKALKRLHIPDIIVTVILLIYRYLFVLISQAKIMYESYIIRAPREKNVKMKIYAIMAGQLLIRSFDRANEVYESMILRGYDEDINLSEKESFGFTDLLFILITFAFCVILRYTDIMSKIGEVFI